MKDRIIIAALVLAVAGLYSFTHAFGGDPWVVPDKNLKMKNPVAKNETSVAAGKALYTKHCQSCHGKSGLGDGTKAAQLEKEPGDFSTKAFQSQPDGSIFYKTQTGRDEMPSFKNKIPDEEDIWSLVNYLRTLGK